MDKFEAQAARFGAEMRPDNVERVDFSGRPFPLWPEGEEEPVRDRSVIIATGAKAKWLGLESEQRLMGRDVSGCATCDGFFFNDKRVAVIGGGDTAMEEANFLDKYASEVVLIHRRDEFRASKIMLERTRKNPKISFLTDTVIEESRPGPPRVGGDSLRRVPVGPPALSRTRRRGRSSPNPWYPPVVSPRREMR